MEIILTHGRLRPWQRGDEASLLLHANNPRVAKNLHDHFPSPYTRIDAEEYINLNLAEARANNLAIEVAGEAAGSIGLVMQEEGSAEIGYWLGEQYWGRGVMTEAVVAMTRYGFEVLKLPLIFATCFPWNKGSMRVLEKAGYDLLEVRKKAVEKAGRKVNTHIYQILPA